jgi:hypothetical protein
MSPAGRLATSASISVVALAAVVGVPSALAGGKLPPSSAIDAAPVSAPGSELAYVTRRAGRDTKLVETFPGGLGVVRRARLAGRFSVPVVANDASPSGLSADGQTLVLTKPRRASRGGTTTLAVVDVRRLRIRRVLNLRGTFSFDAISPDGRTMFLIRYADPRDPTQYSVRAYDLGAWRMLPGRIVDPSEPDEDMSGIPMTRAMGLDGRWAYTLYDGTEHPFIHALDTERREAVCIDMDMLAGRSTGIGDLKLRPTDGRLDVLAGAEVLASVDTSTHELIPRRAAARPPAPSEEAGFPWLIIALPTAAVLLLTALVRRRLALARAARPVSH